MGEDGAAVVGVAAPALEQKHCSLLSLTSPGPPCTGPRSSGRCPPGGRWRPR